MGKKNKTQQSTYQHNESMLKLLLQKQDYFDLIIYYSKVSIIHVAFEAVIAILLVAPQVLYNQSVTKEALSLSRFFGRVLFNCATIFIVVVAIYLLFLLLIVLAVKVPQNAKGIINRNITILSLIGTALGLIIYFIGGLLVANHPNWFAGIEVVTTLSPMEKTNIVIKTTGIGLTWGFLSCLRMLRIVPIVGILSSGEVGEEVVGRANNASSIVRLKSIILQALIMCVIAWLLIRSLKHIPMDDFDYYNLILVVYFGIFSTYSTACYKLEIHGKYPGE